MSRFHATKWKHAFRRVQHHDTMNHKYFESSVTMTSQKQPQPLLISWALPSQI